MVRAGSSACALFIVAVAAAGGCTRTGTNVLTQVRLCELMPASLDVTVGKGGMSIGSRAYAPVREGDSFDVRLPDAFDGQMVQVTGIARDGNGGTLGRVAVDATVRKGQTVEITLSFCGVPRPDLGMPDLAAPDLAAPDLAQRDLAGDGGPAPPDLSHDMSAPPDLLQPDLANCKATCAAGMPATVTNGCCVAQTSVKCSGGCDVDGVHCLVPGCGPNPTPRAIPNNAATTDDNSGAPDRTMSPCGGRGGGEVVFKFTVPNTAQPFGPPVFANVFLSADVGAPAALYTRRGACADGAGWDVPIDGPCLGVAQTATCSSDGAKIKQALCGLEPGDYYAVVDGLTCAGGSISLTPTVAAADLFDCASAGAILGPYPRTLAGAQLSTFGAPGKHAAPQGTPVCGGADLGANSPDLLFYIPFPTKPAGKTITVDLKSAGSPGYMPLLYAGQSAVGACKLENVVCNDGSMPQGLKGPHLDINGNNLAAGPLFLVVDGLAASSGTFSLTIDVK